MTSIDSRRVALRQLIGQAGPDHRSADKVCHGCKIPEGQQIPRRHDRWDCRWLSMGLRDPELVTAVAEQAGNVTHTSNLVDRTGDGLSERLVRHTFAQVTF